MSESSGPVLPFDIIERIIDILFIPDDHDYKKSLQYVKEFSLTCRSFVPVCRKRIFFSTKIRVGNHSLFRRQHRFEEIPDIELFERHLLEMPTIRTYIRQLTIHFIQREAGPEYSFDQIAQQLTRLQSLTVSLWSHRQTSTDWNDVPSLTQDSLINLIHLPTLSRLSLQTMKNFPISSLITCTNLTHLSVGDQHLRGKHDEPGSSLLNKPMQLDLGMLRPQSQGLLEAKRPDGQPALDFTSLEKIYIDFHYGWKDVAREIFKKTHQITDIDFDVGSIDFRDLGLATMIAPSLQTLRRVELKFIIHSIENPDDDPLLVLCNELADISGRNRLESIKMRIMVFGEGVKWVGLEKILLNSGWPMLNHVSLILAASDFYEDDTLAMSLQSLPQTQFTGFMSCKDLDFHFAVESTSSWDW